MLSLLYILSALAASTTAAPAAKSQASRFTFYDLSAGTGPCDLATGPDGALWGQDQLANKIFRIDPNVKGGDVQEYPIPFTAAPIPGAILPAAAGRAALSCAIRSGRDGNLYAANGLYNQLVKINPTTKKIEVFTPTPPNPVGDLQPFNDLYSAKDGIYFSQTTGNVITFFSFKTHEFRNFAVSGSPLGVFVSHDGYVYYAEFLGNKIGRLNGTTGEIKEYPLPAALFGPAVIRVETQDRYIFFASFLSNAIGRLDPQTGAVKVYKNDIPGSFPAEDTLDSKGNVWFSSTTQDVLSKLDPKTGKITHVVQPDAVQANPALPPFFEIAQNYGPGNAIWFTEETVSRVGRYQLD